jgi:glutamine cyclotransferase
MSTQLTPLRSFTSPGTHLCGLAWDGINLWYSDGDTHLLYQLDPRTGKILSTLPCPEVRTGLSYDGGYLWQVAGRPKRIRLIAPQDGQVRDEIPLGPRAETVCGLLVEAETYWTGPESVNHLEQYSRRTGRLIGKFGPVSSGDGIARAGSGLWYTSYRDQALVALNIEAGTEIQRHHLSGRPTGMCWDGTWFWYNDYTDKQICAVQPLEV